MAIDIYDGLGLLPRRSNLGNLLGQSLRSGGVLDNTLRSSLRPIMANISAIMACFFMGVACIIASW